MAAAAVKEAEGNAKSMELNAEASARVVKLNASAEAERVKLTGEAEADRLKRVGQAEAEKILAIGESTAESYRLQVEAMGDKNFSNFKIAETIGQSGMKVTPDILITGANGSGTLEGLLGMQLANMLKEPTKTNKPDVEVVEK
jgi:regulator of protease activity HflC (stomatin/prohibitin superfamily)